MAVAAIPKSEIRKNDSITVGHATIPATSTEDGELAWGLPGGVITTNRGFAQEFAIKLDIEIRRRTTNIQQLFSR